MKPHKKHAFRDACPIKNEVEMMLTDDHQPRQSVSAGCRPRYRYQTLHQRRHHRQ